MHSHILYKTFIPAPASSSKLEKKNWIGLTCGFNIYMLIESVYVFMLLTRVYEIKLFNWQVYIYIYQERIARLVCNNRLKSWMNSIHDHKSSSWIAVCKGIHLNIFNISSDILYLYIGPYIYITYSVTGTLCLLLYVIPLDPNYHTARKVYRC